MKNLNIFMHIHFKLNKEERLYLKLKNKRFVRKIEPKSFSNPN